MRFYVMLCMILMVCICYCCFDNFQIVNFVSTTIFYYNPKMSFLMMNIALTKHVPHQGYMNKYLVHNSIIANMTSLEIFGLLIKKITKIAISTKSTVSHYI